MTFIKENNRYYKWWTTWHKTTTYADVDTDFFLEKNTFS
jgi:hypothetical protein